MIEIDGDYLEGGGQIIRSACAFSLITQEPCHIFNIRQKRENPGLGHQHLLGIRALSEWSGSKIEGDFLESKELKFFPDKKFQEKISIDFSTAASVTLILQLFLPVLVFFKKPLEIKINGGATDTFFSPTVDYFQFVFLNLLEKSGIKTRLNVLKRGYYPQGKAEIIFQFLPSEIKSIDFLKRGQIEKITLISGASDSLKEKMTAERQIFGAREILLKTNVLLEEKKEYYKTSCPGSNLCLIAQFENTILGADALGIMGKRSEDAGKEAALELLKQEKTNACLDKNMADQIIPYLAIARQKSKVKVSELTDHAKTNVWVVEKFLGKVFEIKENIIAVSD